MTKHADRVLGGQEGCHRGGLVHDGHSLLIPLPVPLLHDFAADQGVWPLTHWCCFCHLLHEGACSFCQLDINLPEEAIEGLLCRTTMIQQTCLNAFCHWQYLGKIWPPLVAQTASAGRTGLEIAFAMVVEKTLGLETKQKT